MAYPFFLFTIGITTASAAFLGTKMLNKINEIKNDWKNQRCKPHIMAAAYVPGVAPKGVDATQNYQDCQYGMASGFFGALIAPVNVVINTINDVLQEFNKNIQNIRNMFNQLRVHFQNSIRSIISKVYNLYVKIAWLFNRIISMIVELIRIFGDLFGVLIYAFYTLASVWNGSIGDVAKFFCFDGNTKIKMQNGFLKSIKDIQPGDKLFHNTAIGCMKFTSKDSKMYGYKGVRVAGCHLVKEYNKWIRIEDSKYKHSIEYDNKYIYCLSTSDSKITINNIEFADYLETNKKDEIYQIFHYILAKLNNNSLTIGNIYNNNLNYNLYPWCVHKNTLIDLENGDTKQISKYIIGDKIKGGHVLSIIKFKNEKLDLYNYNNIICTGSMIIYENGFWIPVYSSIYAIRIQNEDEIYYNIGTSSNEFYSNGIKFKDFEQINKNDVNDAIDKYIIGRRL
jgi:hypothetical protein